MAMGNILAINDGLFNLPEDMQKVNVVPDNFQGQPEIHMWHSLGPAHPSSGSGDVHRCADAFWRVVLPTALALILCNMDRICMAVAIVPMAKEFGWAPGVQVGLSCS